MVGRKALQTGKLRPGTEVPKVSRLLWYAQKGIRAEGRVSPSGSWMVENSVLKISLPLDPPDEAGAG